METRRLAPIILALIAFCFLTTVINIFYSSQNRSLRSCISKISEEKNILKAKYHSTIAASNLTYQADEFNMVQATGHDRDFAYSHKGISGIGTRTSNAWGRIMHRLSKENILISGY